MEQKLEELQFWFLER